MHGVKKLSKRGMEKPVKPINSLVDCTSTAYSPNPLVSKPWRIRLIMPLVSSGVNIAGKYLITVASAFISAKGWISASVHWRRPRRAVEITYGFIVDRFNIAIPAVCIDTNNPEPT